MSQQITDGCLQAVPSYCGLIHPELCVDKSRPNWTLFCKPVYLWGHVTLWIMWPGSAVCSLQAVDLSKPIDKRIYKGTQPTCHDFNQYSATAESVALIVGFSAGQVQYLDPIKKETSKLFNEEVRIGCFHFWFRWSTAAAGPPCLLVFGSRSASCFIIV